MNCGGGQQQAISCRVSRNGGHNGGPGNLAEEVELKNPSIEISRIRHFNIIDEVRIDSKPITSKPSPELF